MSAPLVTRSIDPRDGAQRSCGPGREVFARFIQHPTTWVSRHVEPEDQPVWLASVIPQAQITPSFGPLGRTGR
jgi:hypothetical protein